MVVSLVALLAGLALLLWSADRFVEGAASTARHYGMPPLLIGMVVVGFGTSAPELVVSTLAALQGTPGLALGNAYGSNITNIALILGLTAVISPIAVHSGVLRKELPLLAAVTAFAAWQLRDGWLGRLDAWLLLATFGALTAWTVRQGLRRRADPRAAEDPLAVDVQQELDMRAMPLRRAATWLGVGLLLLVVSSRILVWGAVRLAEGLGASDLVIGLTVVAIGTSLPELASSLVAARRGEHDLALGNVLGSNLFNTLAVVGVAGAIQPMAVAPEVLERDLLTVGVLSLALFVLAWGFRGPGRINRVEGGALLVGYLAYVAWLIGSEASAG